MAEDPTQNQEAENKQSLQLAREEGRETITEQVQNLRDIDQKAARILRLNLIIISLTPTVLSIIFQSDNSPGLSVLLNEYTIFGLFCLLLSTGLAALTYTATDVQVGVGNDDLREIVDGNYEEEIVLENLVMAYGDWIEFNTRTGIRNAPYITLTVLLIVAAITNFVLGVIEISHSVPPYVIVVAAIGFLLLAKLAGLPRQLSRWRAEVEPINSIRYWLRAKAEDISERRF